MSSNKKPVAKYRYRNVDVTKDIGKQIEVRDSTSSRWRKKILVGIKNGSLYYFQAEDLEGLRTKGWVFARIREENSNGEDKSQPYMPEDNLYRKAGYGDIHKTVQVRNSTDSNRLDSVWVENKLLDVNFNNAHPYHCNGGFWKYARILKEEPKANDELYREVTRADIGKEVEVLQHKSMSWKKGILKDFDETVEFCQYQVDNLWWDKARIRKEEPANPPTPPQEKPLQSHVAARFDCIDPVVMKLLAECLGYGAKKYPPFNYLRIPVEDHINHALNHINEHRRLHQVEELNSEDELHLVHALARVLFAISTLVQQGQYAVKYTHPELLANPISGGEE